MKFDNRLIRLDLIIRKFSPDKHFKSICQINDHDKKMKTYIISSNLLGDPE